MWTPESESLELVLSRYPYRTTGIRNESYKGKKGVWWINTGEGLKILKRVSSSEETLKYILDAVRHLSSRGVRLPKIYRTKDGREYVCIDGVCYILMEAVEGTNPSYESVKELAAVVRGLAGFHKASAGFSPSPGTKPKYHLGLWVDDYTEQLEDIKGFLKDERFNSSEPLITREFPYFARRAEDAVSGLRGREYEEWSHKVEAEGCLCHQDFAAGNLILTDSGGLCVLDMDSITVDIPARDIRKLLNKIMKKHGRWDMEKTKRILDIYQSENALSRSEWKVVMLDLMFPHLFLGAVNKYCYRRDSEWTDEKYHKRIAEMSDFEKTIKPILEQFERIIPA